jgi:hypothetical protein
VFGHSALFCKSYRCNRCRPPKLKEVRARICAAAEKHKLNKMATLTLDRKRLTRNEQRHTDRYIRECWRSMRVLLARKYGKKIARKSGKKSIPFVGVLEFQKNGAAHLHILLADYIPQKWLSKAWQKVGGGRYVDIRFVDVHRVSAYLSSYLAGDKVTHTLELLPKRARIFTTSRSIVLWGKQEKSGWWLRRVDIGALYDAAQNPSNVRFEAVEDLKTFGLELLSYFESPPLQEAIGNRNVIGVLKAAIPVWKASTS